MFARNFENNLPDVPEKHAFGEEAIRLQTVREGSSSERSQEVNPALGARPQEGKAATHPPRPQGGLKRCAETTRHMVNGC